MQLMTSPSQTFLSLLPQDIVAKDRARVAAALVRSEGVYKGLMHWSGETILGHCIGVASILLSYSADPDAIIAALLHHAIDGGNLSLRTIEKEFGRDVRRIVEGIHLLSRIAIATRRMSIENLRLMFLRLSNDVRTVFIVLCAKVYTLRHIASVPVSQRVPICRDSLRIYAPIAARLGIYALKHELEGLAFPLAYPSDAARISEQLHTLHADTHDFLQHIADSLKQSIVKSGIHVRIDVREKQPFSLFTKMQMKSITDIRGVYDLFALRIIAGDASQCYQILGILHRIGHPIPHRFKDYIGFPKPNGYQSLHTTLARLPGLPEGIFIEVQIRTERMHREAELGIAAHWSYKERGSKRRIDADFARMLSLRRDVEGGKTTLLRSNIFVLTPRGDVFELPEGATPLDFAFSIHTDLGISFRSARVNGSIVPMGYTLENGDIVEVMKWREPRPSPRWFQLLKTASARSRLRRYLAERDRPTNIVLGRDMLNLELARFSIPSLDSHLSLLQSIDGVHVPFVGREDFLAALGQGTRTLPSALSHIDLLRQYPSALLVFPQASRAKKIATSSAGVSSIALEGRVPLRHRHARCCKPDASPGCPVAGVVSKAGEVRIHRQTCPFLRNVNPQRRISAVWEP